MENERPSYDASQIMMPRLIFLTGESTSFHRLLVGVFVCMSASNDVMYEMTTIHQELLSCA